MKNTHIHFLNDSIKDLILKAQSIGNYSEFEKGNRLGFYQAISHLVNQAEAFGFLNELDSEVKEFNLETII